jgi:cell division protein FtsL
MNEELLKMREEIDKLPEEEKIKKIADSIGMKMDDQDIQHAKMTDEQLDAICNVLADNKPEVLNDRMDFESEEYKEYVKQLQSSEQKEHLATVAVNPINGGALVLATHDEDEIGYIDKPTEEIDLVKIFDKEKEEITFDLCKETFVNIYGITDKEEQKVLFDAIMDVDNVKFDDLPSKIKGMVMGAIQGQEIDNKIIDEFTKYLLNNMKTDIVANKAATVDLDKEISKYKSESNKIMSEALEHNRTVLEKELSKIADKAEQEGLKKKAAQLRRCIKGFVDSYTFEPLFRDWKTLKIKGKRVSIKKYLEAELPNYRQHIMKFDNRYRQSNKNIHSSGLILHTLKRCLPNESEQDLKKFVILFCMYSSLLDVNKYEDHIFMYYTIHDIISLDAIPDKSIGLSREILENIKKVIDEVIK